MWNYSKLCFNTKYPWESSPRARGSEIAEVEAQQYVLQDAAAGGVQKANVTFWHGIRQGVLYRRQYFNYNIQDEAMWIQGMNLADFPVPDGIFRVDKHKLFRRPVTITLGAYGLPDQGTEIIEKSCGTAKAIILKGKDFTGRDKQLAMTIYHGWTDLKYLYSQGSNPDSEKSIIVYAETRLNKQYGGYEPNLLISQVITKESREEFKEDEIFPVGSIDFEDENGLGSYGTVTISMKNGLVRQINFEGMEGKLML